MGLMESPRSWKIVKLVFLRNPEAAPKKGIRRPTQRLFQKKRREQSNSSDVGDVEVVSCSVWRKKKSQKNGRSYTLVDWMG